jgi:hypothetical protein
LGAANLAGAPLLAVVAALVGAVDLGAPTGVIPTPT